MSLQRFTLTLLAALGLPVAGRADSPPAPSDLADYVRKEDGAYKWKVAGKTTGDSMTVYELELISQTWHGTTWSHVIQVFVPKGAKPRSTMVLWNQGGTPTQATGILAARIATNVGAPVAFLYGVPNQPLLGGKTEDALIAETFVRYLETKDSSWPLLFPMVKSVVRAMDALQAFAVEEWKVEVENFIVTGASKRGWTSWLSAASGDLRVKAIAPLVIDTLNFPLQMKNQVAAFGKPSAMIHDYTERNLVPIPDTGDGRKLWRMVDPWVYREKILVPKMIIDGTNDPYWPLDALNGYWDDLKGEKHLLYVPNAGHDLREVDNLGKKQVFPIRAVNTLSAFCKCQVFGLKMPELRWKFEGGEERSVFTVTARAKAIRTWKAEAQTRDFRQVRWSISAETEPGATIDRAASLVVSHPTMGFVAVFQEVDYELDGLTFSVCTQIHILEAKK